MEVHDVVIVGGGPAGSTCARLLVQGGLRVAVVDRAHFPRVKLCSGWLSTPIWDALGLAPHEYPGGLWEWRRCHVRHGGRDHAVRGRGWFVRRYELDDFLLRRSGAELHLGVSVRDVARGADDLWSVAGLRARTLVGAGGTRCPVGRWCAPPRPQGPVGVQEREFPADPATVTRTRLGRDGEPELLLHDDLGGYSWNVPKTSWLNVGSGTAKPAEVRAAWQKARGYFEDAGHLPAESAHELDAMAGYAYYLFHPDHLAGAAHVGSGGQGGVYLVGDSLGLAHPLTAEGILPAVLSGRLLAEAILAGQPASYPARLRAHPVLADYRRVVRLLDVARRARRPAPAARVPARWSSRALATGFGWMFSGARLPTPRLIDLALYGAERWLDGKRTGAPSTKEASP